MKRNLALLILLGALIALTAGCGRLIPSTQPSSANETVSESDSTVSESDAVVSETDEATTENPTFTIAGVVIPVASVESASEDPNFRITFNLEQNTDGFEECAILVVPDDQDLPVIDELTCTANSTTIEFPVVAEDYQFAGTESGFTLIIETALMGNDDVTTLLANISELQEETAASLGTVTIDGNSVEVVRLN